MWIQLNQTQTRTLKNTKKKINFIHRLKHAEQKIFCMCVDVYKIFDGNDYNKMYEVLSTMKIKKLKLNNILMEKYKDMLKNPNFEQNKYSITSAGNYRIGHDSIRLMKWICYYDQSYYENINYFDSMGTVCKYLILIEISCW